MYKIKSHSGAKKRFQKTSKGLWKHKKAGLRHLLTPDSGERGRILRKPGILNKTEGEILRKYLPYN